MLEPGSALLVRTLMQRIVSQPALLMAAAWSASRLNPSSPPYFSPPLIIIFSFVGMCTCSAAVPFLPVLIVTSPTGLTGLALLTNSLFVGGPTT